MLTAICVAAARSDRRQAGRRRPAARRLPRSAARRRLLVVPRAHPRASSRCGRPETTLVASDRPLLRARAARAGGSATRSRSARSSPARSSPSPGTAEGDRAPGAAGARHVRRDLLRLGRHADRPGADRRSTGRRRRCFTVRRHRRQDRRRLARRVPHRQRHAHLGPGRHEPGADRRVLVHHRRPRRLARRDRRVPLPGRVAVSAITTLTTPWLIRASGAVAARSSIASCPQPLQTFAALYGRWLEALRDGADDAPTVGAHPPRRASCSPSTPPS